MSDVETVTLNDELPRLLIVAPECEHCGNRVEVVDAQEAQCRTCKVSWSPITEDGEPEPIDGPLAATCGIVVDTYRMPWTEGGKVYTPGKADPCILPKDHGGGCLNPYSVTIRDAVTG